jgi:hypothetical protein
MMANQETIVEMIDTVEMYRGKSYSWVVKAAALIAGIRAEKRTRFFPLRYRKRALVNAVCGTLSRAA